MVNERLKGIDFIKGIAIFSVVLVHILYLIPRYRSAVFAGLSFSFSIPFFFFCYGFFTREHYTKVASWPRFFWRKFILMAVPFLLWSLIYYFALLHHKGDHPLLTELFGGGRSPFVTIAAGFSAPHFYFIIAYFSFWPLLPFIAALLKKFSCLNLSLACIALIALNFVYLLLMKTNFDHFVARHDMYIRFPYHWFSFYFFGVLVSLHKDRLVSLMRKMHPFGIAAVMIISLSLGCAMVYKLSEGTFYFSLFFSVFWFFLSLFFSVFLFCLFHFARRTKFANLMIFYGQNTYPVYLSHILFIGLAYFLGPQFRSYWQTYLFVFAFTILMSTLYLFVHRIVFRADHQSAPIFKNVS